MTGPIVHSTIDAGGAITALLGIETRAADLTPVFEGPGKRAVLAMFAEVFKTQGASIGAKWAALSPVTLKLKAKRRRAKMGIGRDSDRLYRSLTVRSSPDQIAEVTPTSLTMGTSVNASGYAYPARFQSGGPSTTIFGRARKAGSDASDLATRAGLKVVNVPGRKLVPDELPATTRQVFEDAAIRYLTEGRV